MPLRSIPANEYRRVRWRNGGGWTREIATGRMSSPSVDVATPAGDWDWRLSIAEIERDGPFSEFAGCDRVLVLLGGNGMRLDFSGREGVELHPPHGRIAFAGEDAVQCALLDGSTTDFNAMVRRACCTMQVFHRPLVGSMVFFAEAGVLWAVHLMAGRARVQSEDAAIQLEAGDTAFIDNVAGTTSLRSILDGGGDALLVRIERRHA
ncbi:MAG: HutD family protein [Proteobacteria bacterium]|nr:HutD family protein [Pseudomonadota bacterium]